MSSTHSLSRAQGHASLVSRASGHAAHLSHSSSGSSLFNASVFPAFHGTSGATSRSLASVSCGAAQTIANASGFEDADGNLNVDTTGCADWNSFSPAWSGNTGTATLGDLSFIGLTDPVNSSSDSIYSGGVKQDTVCPSVTTGNVNDKADLGRIYVATETVNGHVYLFLAWERQIDNTINSDVFVSFEFDQGKLACANNDGFVQRTQGDLLFDYNFQSGNSTIDAKEWDGSTWVALTTPPFEAAVNSGTVTDTLGPGASHDLTTFEFGEAGIDLSALNLAGNGGKACETFGSVLGGSRTSKSGDQAQLKDYVGPAPVDVSNCVQPTVTTTLKNAAGGGTIVDGSSIANGSSVYDTATLGNLVSGKTPTGKVQYTFFTNSDCSAGGTDAGLVTLDGSGNVPNSDTEGPLAAGDYGFEAQYLSGDDPNYSDSAVSSCEPFTVLKASPTITTDVSESAGGTGDSISDSATLHSTSNLLGTGSVTFYLYAPGATCHNDGSGTTVYSHVASSTVSTNGPFASGSFGPPLVAGTYQWVAVFSGDANNGSASSGCGSEPVVITASPTITTDQTPKSGSLGDTLNDSASLHGTSNLLGTGSVTIYLFEPGVDCSTDGTGAVDSWTFDGVSDNGPIDTSTSNKGGFVSDQAGIYHFLAVFSGDTNNPGPVDSGCTSEPVTITASPTIVTTPSETSGSVGDLLNDSATLSDGSNFDGQGTITFNLYGPNDPTCDGEPAYTEMVSADHNGSDYSTSNTTVTADTAGTWNWTASFSGDGNNNPASSDCGEESVVINPAAIHVLKTADAAKVNVGSPIGFTLTVYNDGSGDARGVRLSDTLPTNAGLSWSIAGQGSDWASTCAISAGVLSCGPVTVPAGTTQAASTFTVHIVSGTTAATGGDCPGSGTVDNTGIVTTSNDGTDQSSASTCVQALVDLSITKAGSPATQTLGAGNITWTIVVTNNGPDTDTGVTIADPMPAGNTFVSATSTQGTCTGGAILNCSIGTMASGASVTITLVTTPSTVGAQTNTATVAGSRPETNTANNQASATVQTVGVITPPVFCVAVSKVTPKQLFVGRKTKLTIHVTQHGLAVKGVHVQIKGPKTNIRTAASNGKGVITQNVKMKKAGILIFSPIASKRCNTKRVGVTNVFTPPVTG